MRIFQVITLSELGGAQSVVANLSNKLCEQNEVIVIAGEGDGKMFVLLNPNIQIEHVPSLVRRLSPINELKTIIALRRLYRKYKPDIIHLHSSKAGLLGRIAFPKSKIVYTVHGFDSIRLAYRKFLIFEKLLQSRCASIVGVSKYDEQNLIKEGINNNVSYVYNGIFQPLKITADPFKDYSSFKGKILCIARISPQKNLNLFIEIAKRLPDYAFIWIGNQEPPDIDYPNNVFFLGNISNAGSYIEYANLFLLTSNYEGLPMVIIESLSNGTPVIASAVGGITELLNGGNGWTCINDPDKMVGLINDYFLLSADEKSEISKRAKESYLEKFTVDKMVEGYKEIYNKINQGK